MPKHTNIPDFHSSTIARSQAGPEPGPVVALPDADQRTLVRRPDRAPRRRRTHGALLDRLGDPVGVGGRDRAGQARCPRQARTSPTGWPATPPNVGPRWHGGRPRRSRANRGSSRWTTISRRIRSTSRTRCSIAASRGPPRHSPDRSVDLGYRLLRANQNPVLRRARSLVGAARRRRAAARLR